MSEIQKYTPEVFSPIEARMKEAGLKPEQIKQELSFAVQQINRSPMLQKCDKITILQAVTNISNIGLSLNPAAKESYLVPRWNNNAKSYEAVLDPSYVGLVKLLTDAGSVSSICAHIVYEKDNFTLLLSDNKNPVHHSPCLKKSDRGTILGAYALATLPDGTRQAEWMDIEEIYLIRDRSESYKAFKAGKVQSCVWTSDEGEMIRKTVIKRIFKYLPRTERMNYIDQAVKLDNEDYMATDDQVNYIESLLQTSTLDQHHRDALEMEVSVMNRDRASQVIAMLRENQLDPITSGMNYGQSQIKEHLKNF